MAETRQVTIPDNGDFKDVPVIEVLVKSGDSIEEEDRLIVLGWDKATIEVPAPFAGVVSELSVHVADKVSQGTPILMLEIAGTDKQTSAPQPTPAPPPAPAPAPASEPPSHPAPKSQVAPTVLRPSFPPSTIEEAAFAKAHASPSVRRFARELGVNL